MSDFKELLDLLPETLKIEVSSGWIVVLVIVLAFLRRHRVARGQPTRGSGGVE